MFSVIAFVALAGLALAGGDGGGSMPFGGAGSLLEEEVAGQADGRTASPALPEASHVAPHGIPPRRAILLASVGFAALATIAGFVMRCVFARRAEMLEKRVVALLGSHNDVLTAAHCEAFASEGLPKLAARTRSFSAVVGDQV